MLFADPSLPRRIAELEAQARQFADLLRVHYQPPLQYEFHPGAGAVVSLPERDPIFLIQNATSEPLPQFAIVGRGDPLIYPKPADRHHKFDTVYKSGAPLFGRIFYVLQESAAVGQFAPAIITGRTWCRVLVSDESHQWAAPIDGSYTRLASAAAGPAKILWKESGTGEKWADVLLCECDQVAPPASGSGQSCPCTLEEICTSFPGLQTAAGFECQNCEYLQQITTFTRLNYHANRGIFCSWDIIDLGLPCATYGFELFLKPLSGSNPTIWRLEIYLTTSNEPYDRLQLLAVYESSSVTWNCASALSLSRVLPTTSGADARGACQNYPATISVQPCTGSGASGGGGVTLVGWWKANEGSGDTLYDYSGINNDLPHYSGEITWDSDTPGSQAGAGGCVSIASDTDLAFAVLGYTGIPTGNAAVSGSFWYKLTSGGGTATTLFAYGNGSNQIGFTRRTDLSRVFSSTPFNHDDSAATTGWHLYTWTWDGTTAKYYEDGVFVDADTPGAALTTDLQGYLQINLNGVSGGRVKIKDVRLYEGTLSAVDVAAIYDGSFGP